MEYEIRIPKNVLHWYENGELVKNPEFSNNMEVYRVGINANYEDIQELQANVINLDTTVSEHTSEIAEMQDNIASLLVAVASIPNKTSDLINDSDFITHDDLPTEVSDLANDSGFMNYNDITVGFGLIKTEVPQVSGVTGVLLQVATNLPTIGANVTISDTGNYFSSDTVDGALQEIGYTLKTGVGTSIVISINPNTFVITLQLKNSDGTIISSGTVDLPLETMVVNATYDSTTKEIVLTLQNGNTVRFSVADLVSGLVDETTFNTAIANINTALAGKVDKVTGKGLSTNDYTNEEKTKLAGLENYDDTEVRADIDTLEESKLNEKDAVSMFSNAVYGEVSTPSKNFSINSAYGYFGRKLLQDKLEYDLKLLGESTQYTTTGSNILPTNGLIEQTISGVKFTPVYEDEKLQYININGTITGTEANVNYEVGRFDAISGTKYYISGVTGWNYDTLQLFVGDNVAFPVGNRLQSYNGEQSATASGSANVRALIYVYSGQIYDNVKIYPMISLSSASYEPYTGGKPAPSPNYPQEIESVEAQNLFDVGTVSDYTGSGSLIIQDDKLIHRIDSGSASYKVKSEKFYKNKIYISANYDRLDATPRFLVRAFDENDNQITSSVTGWSYNAYYNAYYRDEAGEFNLPSAEYIQIGFAWKGTEGEYGTYSKIMISTEALPYRPYGCIGIESIGRNKIGYNNSLPYSKYGIDLTRNNEIYIVKGTATTWFWKSIFTIPAGTLNGRYLLKKIPLKGISKAEIRIADRTVTPNIVYGSALTENTLDITNTHNDLVVEITTDNVSTYDEQFQILLQPYDIIDKSYVPYVKHTSYIKLNHPMRSDKEKTVRDSHKWVNGVWYDIQRIFKKILNGTENWTLDTTKEITQVFALTNGLPDMSTSNTHCISNYFIDNAAGDAEKIAIGARNIYIAINKTTASTVEEFKTWLLTHNTIVDYVLETPIVTEITDEATIEALETIRTYTGLTEITSDIDITGSYVQDINEAIPTKLSELTNDSGYVKDNDYATSSKGGVIKLGWYNVQLDSSGHFYAATRTYEQYSSDDTRSIIGKGTLENVLTGKGINSIRKTILDNVLVPNAMYDLGSTDQASLTLTLPTPASEDNYSCNDIYVAFKSGSTATTLNIVGSYEGDTSYLPNANCICELSFKYICGTWVLVTKETEVSSS